MEDIKEVENYEDLVTFNREVLIWFDHLSEVFQLKQKSSLSQDKPEIQKTFERYVKLYNKTKPIEHVEYFTEIFNNNHNAIIAFTSDEWLRQGKIKIKWQSELKIEISVSTIYSHAILMKNKVETEMNKEYNISLRDTFRKRKELIMPNLLLLDMYKIFRCCLKIEKNNTDIKLLDSIIQNLEKTLRIKTIGPAADISNPFKVIYNTLPALLGNFMGGEKNGDVALPPYEQVQEKFMGIFQNESVKNFFTNIGENLQSGNYQAALGHVVNNIGDENLIKNVKESMPEIAEFIPDTAPETLKSFASSIETALPAITKSIQQVAESAPSAPVATEETAATAPTPTPEINLMDL